jgi:Trypsin
MRPILFLPSLLLACSTPITQTEQAIINGTFEPGRPAVVAIVGPNGPFCSGALISRRVVVTAAHCADINLTQIDPANYQIFFGADFNRGDGIVYPTAQVIKDPGFSVETLRNDIGVVVLAQDAPVAPIAFRQIPLDDSFFSQEMTFVGYGLPSPFAPFGGLKQKTVIPLLDFNDTQFFYDGLSTNTCFGDSGGPSLQSLANGEEVVVGVTSFGDQFCAQFGANTRVDAFVSSFLQPILEAEAPLEEGCGLDDACNTNCGSPDPDCDLANCDAGNVCNRDCPELDPDCEDISCKQDNICDKRCSTPETDFDCVCKADGVCADSCGDADPDCGGSCQTNPNTAPRWFPLVAFFCFFVVWRRRRLC